MLQPRRQKHRKQFRGKMRGKASGGFNLDFGDYGLKAQECHWLKAKQIEAARKAITNYTKRAGKVWVRVFPDKPITKKAPGAPMGQGKADPSEFVCVIKPGRMIFEISGLEESLAKEALRRAADKLPFRTKFISRQLETKAF